MTSLPQTRRMIPADLDRVMEIAARLPEAPQWPRAAYLAALEPAAALKRIALVVENPAGAKAQDLLADKCGTTEVVPCYKTSPQLQINPQLQTSSLLNFSAELTDVEGVGVIGFAVASLLPPEAELELIAVDPAAQRRGLAQLLFRELAAELRRAQVKEMILEVRASNRAALALYRKLGLIESGRRKDYYQFPVEDALLMRLGL